MTASASRQELYRRASGVSVPWMIQGGAVLAVLGAVSFLIFALGSDPGRAWRIYHVNFLFFTGLAQGAVVFVAAYRITKGWWAGPIVRFAEAMSAFLPVALVLFLVLFLGRHHLFPWIEHPTPVRGPWLTTGFVFWRDLLSLVVLFGVTLTYVYHDLRPDVAPLVATATGWRRRLYEWIAGDYTGTPEQLAKVEHRLTWMAPLLVVLYGYLFSIIAFDLVMSLAPYWYSTIFGWFFFMGAFLTGLTTTGLMMVYWRHKLGLHELIRREQFHDLGKLVFGFSVFWTYLMFSQFLVQWYGNLRVETAYQFFRMAGPWRPLAWTVGLMVFFVPFWGLIWVRSKTTPATFSVFLSVSFAGVWLERYLLVEPVAVDVEPAFGLPEVGITLGFLGLFLLCYGLFARAFPMISPRHAEDAAKMVHH
ncbi:MAG TPA: NrfD/PsrC family molybdoenzyme membrane anchor subunit [Gemmatimonadales bacterium]|nr:NrfD/PsrC family molybdoenzyme membrane anchor subunit [Gemmatimonadales bacterium]